MSVYRPKVRHLASIGLVVLLAGCTASGGGCAPTAHPASTTTTTEVGGSTTTTEGPGGSTSTTIDSTTTTDPGPTTTVPDTTVPGDGGLVALAAVDVEDCITPADDNTFLSQVAVTECGEPHEAEVFAQFTLDRAELPGTGDEYPGGNELTWYAQDECQDRFAAYTGHSYWTSPYDLRTVTPSFSTWDTGDRAITCLIVAGDGAMLTASARTT